MRYLHLLPIFSLFLICSCSKNRLQVDLSEVPEQHVSIMRLDQAMFNLNKNAIDEESKKIAHSYGSFYNRFASQILNPGGTYQDSSYLSLLKLFVTDPDMRAAYADCQNQYPKLTTEEEALSEAFRYYRYHFPKRSIPKVVACMSGFNYQVTRADSMLGVSLEMFLGTDYPTYGKFAEPFPMYKRRTMNQAHLVPLLIKGFALTEFENNFTKADFLSEIVNRGRQMYVVDALLPETADTLKWAYTGNQLKWCERNEANMWRYFLERKLLYSTEMTEMMRYLADGPFTAAFNKESPGGVGYWIGYRIVQKFMNDHPEVNLEELMRIKDASQILTRSKYKPKGE